MASFEDAEKVFFSKGGEVVFFLEDEVEAPSGGKLERAVGLSGVFLEELEDFGFTPRDVGKGVDVFAFNEG